MENTKLQDAAMDAELEKYIHAHAEQVATTRVRENNITWLIITMLLCLIFIGYEILKH